MIESETDNTIYLTWESSNRLLNRLHNTTSLVERLNHVISQNKDKVVLVRGVYSNLLLCEKIVKLEEELEKLKNHIKETE